MAENKVETKVADVKVAAAPVAVKPKEITFSAALRIVGCSHMWMRRMVTERHYFDAHKDANGNWMLNETKVKAYAEHYRASTEKSEQPWR